MFRLTLLCKDVEIFGLRSSAMIFVVRLFWEPHWTRNPVHHFSLSLSSLVLFRPNLSSLPAPCSFRMELKHLRKAEQQQQQQVQQEQPLLPVEKQLLRQYATINESKIPVVSGGGGGAGSSATIPPTRGSAARTSHHHMTLRGISDPIPASQCRRNGSGCCPNATVHGGHGSVLPGRIGYTHNRCFWWWSWWVVVHFSLL